MSQERLKWHLLRQGIERLVVRRRDPARRSSMLPRRPGCLEHKSLLQMMLERVADRAAESEIVPSSGGGAAGDVLCNLK